MSYALEPLSLPQPDSGLTGTEALAVHDLAEKRTVPLSPAVSGVFSRNGILWWYTGDVINAGTWHTLDLRTITG